MKRNWQKYNRSLVNRGSITFWFEQDAIEKWIPPKNKRRGRPKTFSDQAILTACILRFVYSLSLRAAEGFLRSLIQLLQLSLPSPTYTRICRRMRSLDLSEYRSKRRPTDIVFDSTGLKVFGEGEWKIEKHGKSKRKLWKKFHIAIDPASGEIIVGQLTGVGVADCELLPVMLNKCPRSVKKAYGDGAYDTMACRKSLQRRGIEEIIPPRRKSKPHWREESRGRDDAIFMITGLGGGDAARKLWKIGIGYHRRSLVETAISSWKRVLGGALKNRLLPSQLSEISIKSFIFNRMRK